MALNFEVESGFLLAVVISASILYQAEILAFLNFVCRRAGSVSNKEIDASMVSERSASASSVDRQVRFSQVLEESAIAKVVEEFGGSSWDDSDSTDNESFAGSSLDSNSFSYPSSTAPIPAITIQDSTEEVEQSQAEVVDMTNVLKGERRRRRPSEKDIRMVSRMSLHLKHRVCHLQRQSSRHSHHSHHHHHRSESPPSHVPEMVVSASAHLSLQSRKRSVCRRRSSI